MGGEETETMKTTPVKESQEIRQVLDKDVVLKEVCCFLMWTMLVR